MRKAASSYRAPLDTRGGGDRQGGAGGSFDSTRGVIYSCKRSPQIGAGGSTMKMLKAGTFVAAPGLALMLVASHASAQEVKLRASGSFPAGHTGSIAMEVFKSELARRTNGAIAVELFPGNTLGG